MATKIEISAGTVHGRWTVLSRAPRRPGRKTYWLCRCECGTEREVYAYALRSKKSTSCGCYKRELTERLNLQHGSARTGKKSKEYQTWTSMIQRCENPNAQDYPNYGGRGIKVGSRWRRFENFLADMGAKPSEDHSIERIDNMGDYCPENCRWALVAEQNRNSRHNRVLEFEGVRACITEWSDLTDIPPDTIRARLNCGWSIERTLREPVGHSPKGHIPSAKTRAKMSTSHQKRNIPSD